MSRAATGLPPVTGRPWPAAVISGMGQEPPPALQKKAEEAVRLPPLHYYVGVPGWLDANSLMK